MSLARQESPSAEGRGMTFNQWLHTVLVRPYGEFIPDVVKRVCDSLELEDVLIDMDLEHHSKRRSAVGHTVPSKKRKLDQIEVQVLDVEEARPKPLTQQVFKRRQLVQVLEEARNP
jgi:hypothetical protein